MSSPSYFPPAGGGGQIVGTTAGIGSTGVRTFLAGQNAAQWTTQNDLIVVGHLAFSAGSAVAPNNVAAFAGSVIVGSQAAPAVTLAQIGLNAAAGPSTIIGFKALSSSEQTSLNTIVGSNVLASWTGSVGSSLSGNVVIGESAGQNITSSAATNNYMANVVIGNLASSSTVASQFKTVRENVIIGFKALNAITGTTGTGGPGIARNVVIGNLAGFNLGNIDSSTGSNDNVIIGNQASNAGNARGNVYIGSSAGTNDVTGATNNVGIGSTNGGTGVTSGSKSNVVVGSDAGNGASNSTCVILGCGAGIGIGTRDYQFLVEARQVGVTNRKTILYGVMSDPSAPLTLGTGLIIGTSVEGTNRDLPGANILKLIAGAASGVAPVGGGFFYLASADNALHYVDTNNIDASLSTSGPAFLGTNLGRISPAALGATQDDYAPAGFATAQVLRLSAAGGGSTLNGLAGGAVGRWVVIINVSANNLTLAHQAGTSAAANRFSLPGAASVVLGANGSIELWFDTDTGNWRSFNR